MWPVRKSRWQTIALPPVVRERSFRECSSEQTIETMATADRVARRAVRNACPESPAAGTLNVYAGAFICPVNQQNCVVETSLTLIREHARLRGKAGEGSFGGAKSTSFLLGGSLRP
ncbi:hypothetical protein R1flu_028377 [Riccia fluitans]|uniref:Uncharacterized protein n=1 Tax=Riccia fluitans TaxID=41844 RepID=A0ABD1XLH2_9MARC